MPISLTSSIHTPVNVQYDMERLIFPFSHLSLTCSNIKGCFYGNYWLLVITWNWRLSPGNWCFCLCFLQACNDVYVKNRVNQTFMQFKGAFEYCESARDSYFFSFWPEERLCTFFSQRPIFLRNKNVTTIWNSRMYCVYHTKISPHLNIYVCQHA